MSIRSRGRQAALQVLYQDDFNQERSRELDRQYLVEQLDNNDDLVVFAWSLIDGVRRYRDEIDQQIQSAADRWELNRLTAIDRNIIRMAVFECQFADTPLQVSIDEAVRCAKRFGGKDSPAFVNGILDFILTGKVKPQTPAGDIDPTENPADKPAPGLKRFLKPKD